MFSSGNPLYPGVIYPWFSSFEIQGTMSSEKDIIRSFPFFFQLLFWSPFFADLEQHFVFGSTGVCSGVSRWGGDLGDINSWNVTSNWLRCGTYCLTFNSWPKAVLFPSMEARNCLPHKISKGLSPRFLLGATCVWRRAEFGECLFKSMVHLFRLSCGLRSPGRVWFLSHSWPFAYSLSHICHEGQ